MTGRHFSTESSAQAESVAPNGHSAARAHRRRPPYGLALLVGATVALPLVLVAACQARSNSARPAAFCLKLQVLATPAIAEAIQQIAQSPDLASPDGCVQVAVDAASDADARSALERGDREADLWIPSSSITADQLIADVSTAGAATIHADKLGSIATSPIVFARGMAGNIGGAGRPVDTRAAAILAVAAMNKQAVSIPDPQTNPEGLLALLAFKPAGAKPSGKSNLAITASVVQLGRSVVASPSDGLRRLASTGSAASGLALASEQAILAQNQRAGRTVLGAIYPSGGVQSLDFPAVRMSRGGLDPALDETTDGFVRALGAVTAQRILATAGFRDPAGDPIAAAHTIGATRVPLLATPNSTDTADTLRLWSAARQDSHTLAVIDVSGSMSQAVGNGQTRIQVAASAAAAAVNFFPDTSAFGLWAFSEPHAHALPYLQLARISALGGRSGGVTQRKTLSSAAMSLPSLVGGGTALYDTSLAAFEEVRNTFDAGKVNSVVLLTDGRNEYPSGLSLSQLLTKLRSLVDPARPVPILTIGVGADADIATLRQISATTGGKAYQVLDPAGIRDVFLDAVFQRQCRPSCSASPGQ